MKRGQRGIVVTALAAAGTIGATGFAAPASAATAPLAAYNGACGAGYTVVDSSDVGTLGTVYLTWNDRNGENCVVTVRTKPGAAVYMHAKVFQTDDTQISSSDSGAYTSYAGPVHIPARFACVTWRGQIADQYVVNTGHCG
ncbi:spore-associated protein A [Streptomyces sp. NPDC048650]|uniref:spore-associated protein A n=1 Tax=unclassified Streptomyces TaxID=2593676 RepID=UPI00371FB0B0